MRTISIIQARLSSSRLPGKVLLDINGKPLLHYVIARTKKSRLVDDVVLATSSSADDNKIEIFCKARGINCFRGDLDDVLKRFYNAACAYKADTVVRITGDCPLIDPEVIDKAINKFKEGGFDYVSNAIERTYPDGLDVEVFSVYALESAFKNARLKSEREHVTPYIYKNPDKFRIGHILHHEDLSAMRWVVDEPRDLAFVRAIFEQFNSDLFGMRDILAFLKLHPELGKINEGILCNEGYVKSLKEDAMVQK